MHKQNNSEDLLEIIPEIIDSEDIFAQSTFNKIKNAIEFDCANFYMLFPDKLVEIFPNTNKIKISEELSKELFKENLSNSNEICSNNHIICYLKIKGVVFGIGIFQKAEFLKKDIQALKTITPILSYKIKDKELSNVFKEQVKTLANAIDKSKKSEKIKTDFIANVSHELRTPLNAIIGYSDLLKNKRVGELNEKQLNYVNNIQTSSVNLLGMINEILDISKLENSSIHLVKQKINIKNVIDEVITILMPLFKEKNIELLLQVKDIEINADFQKLKQVIFNILSNAIKFTRSKIEISTLKENQELIVSIKDDGIGIAKKNHKKIFKKFVQINDYSLKKETSTGLGLTISQEFIKLHNGFITINSELNKGAEFIIKIPFS